MTLLAKILVVDDEKSVCESVSKILVRKGYKVDYSLDAEEALERIRDVPYNLIILDIMMPKINGIDLLRTIRGKFRECNVIMITGYASINTAVESTQIGALAYVAKPFTSDELLSVVENALVENQRSNAFCEKGRMECRKFLKTGPCEDECVIRKKGKFEKSEKAEEDHRKIDADMPFEFDEVEAATSSVYAQTMSRSDIPIIGWRRYYEKSRRILVVDDEVVVCNSVRKILKGYEVDYAVNAEDAMDKLVTQKYGLVLLDLRLPTVSGMELLKTVRLEWPETKVIVITGYGSIESAVESTKLGVLDYITKPFTPEELTTTVEAYMEGEAA